MVSICTCIDLLMFVDSFPVQTAPKDWYIPKNIFFIPPKDELPGSPIDNFKEGFSNLFGGAKK